MSTRKWVISFVIVCILSLAGMLAVRTASTAHSVAVVTVSGKEVLRIDLSRVTSPYTFEVNGKNGKNTVSVSPGRIAITDADCPDRLCVKHGPLRNSYSPIVCLPNRVVITFADERDEVDAVSQ